MPKQTPAEPLDNDASINALVMAVAGGEDKADALRALARNIWWAGFNSAKQVDYQRDLALSHAVGASEDLITVLRWARAFEQYLAGELSELPPATEKRPATKSKPSSDDEARALLERLGIQ